MAEGEEMKAEMSNAQRPTPLRAVGSTKPEANSQLREADTPSTINNRQSGSDQLSAIPQFVWRIAEFIIGAVFIYAGVLKVVDPMSFAIDIDNYQTLPWFIGIRLAFYLPWLEILCGIALITRRLYLGGLSILAVLTSIFIVASVIAKVRGIDISCGCFGHASKYLSFAGHLALDFVILGALLFLLFRQHHARALDDIIVNSGR